ncbi:hypothetical protein FE257_008447 [Aspergillus nanangensis]|uniref:Chromo domain-containing protein n=1 Tax=Aspergillus nanangensis TaxID=2582783 RepID=A0AAD4GSN7_ASPNN|nr:hypothetical protein FE257_008447 [Aspergillus nanangensis]
MPPPLGDVSDDDSTGGSIPYNDAEERKGMNFDGSDNNDNEEEDEDEDEEGVYVVEKIVGHEFAKDGKLILQVKWKGYDDPADQTMEPEKNLMDGAEDLVKEYFKQLGGRPQKPGKQPGRKRKSMGAGAGATKSETAEPKRQRKSQGPPSTAESNGSGDEIPDWVPKNKSWEDYVEGVDTIIRDADTSGLIAYLHWTNGKKTKMLEFYEKHLVFKEA